ncbi:MAG: pantetheine-phosphate adenylyltransferase, partial [Sulfuricaulis sp.]|nr:pantetheine-phosphate adenylyltransferase [Sulfuricaulis sp.]
RLFDEVILGIADSRAKQPFFTLEERVAMAKTALADCRNVKVISFSGLLMKFAQQHGATVVVRGLRAVSDFDYEFQLAGMNRDLYPGVETMFLTPGERYMFVSATIVREISILGGDVSKFVSAHVAARLAAKIRQMGGK